MDSKLGNIGAKRPLRNKLRKIFEKSKEQFRHQRLAEKCKALYNEDTDGESFSEEFKTALRYCLVHPDKEAVDSILSFVARFMILLYAIESGQDDLDTSDTMNEECVFSNAILDLLFKTHNASLAQVRVRCLQLINKILSGMPENSTISDGIWTKLRETVLIRIQDKSPLVRVQAVMTGRKLQDPKNINCEIIRAFVFHLSDPSSAVRRTIVSSIAFNKFTVGHVLARTRDVNDNVRRNTYIVFSKVRVLNLTINYRLAILERGLQDRSAMVRKCVQSVLLVNWLENFNKDILKFLEALDVVNCTDEVLKIVENVFKILPMEYVVKAICLEEDTRLIPKEKLTPEMALLWRAVAHYFWTEKKEEDLEKVLPNITIFCDFIRSLYPLEKEKSLNLNHEEKWREVKEKEILRHLLEIIKVFDLADELGRSNLKKLIFDMLSSERVDNDLVKCLIELASSVIPSSEIFLQEVTEIISELREPLAADTVEPLNHEALEMETNVFNLKAKLNDLREKEHNAASSKDYDLAQAVKAEIEKLESQLKSLNSKTISSHEVREEKNDPVTICKCLTIIMHMVTYSKVDTLTPTLRNIKENFLHQCLTSQDLLTQSLSVKILGQFCVLDLDLAKENLFRFILMLSETGEDEINEPALKSLFDILLYHGIKPFQNLHNCDEKRSASSEKESRTTADLFQIEAKESYMPEDTKFIPILMELLNCKSNDMLKKIAFEGLCKLLLSGTLYSTEILEKIIIKGFSPIIDNDSEDYIRQIFMVFFPAFASTTPRSQEMIEAVFIPTLRALSQAPLGTPEADINIRDVACFIIGHTRSDVNKQASMTLHVHNNLAVTICHELLKEIDQEGDTDILTLYLQSLGQLKLCLDKEPFVNQIRILTNKIKRELGDRTHLRLLNEFKKRVEAGCLNMLTSVENILPAGDNGGISKEIVINEDVENHTNEVMKSIVEKDSENGEETEDDSVGSEGILDISCLNEKKNNFVPESPDTSE